MVWQPKPAGPKNIREMFHWCYKELGLAGSAIVRVNEEMQVNYSLAAYGGLGQSTSAPFTLDANWNTITSWESGSVDTPRGVSQNVAGNGLVLGLSGVWTLYLVLSISFDEANQGRALSVRLYNETQGFGGNPIYFAVGRNQPGQTITLSILAEPGSAASTFAETIAINDNIQVQLRSDDSFSNVNIEAGVFQLNLVSQYGGQYIP